MKHQKIIKIKDFVLILTVYRAFRVDVKDSSIMKKQKTVNENDKITTNTIADKRNTKFGSTGRHTSPDDIFKQDSNLQAGSVEIVAPDGTINNNELHLKKWKNKLMF